MKTIVAILALIALTVVACNLVEAARAGSCTTKCKPSYNGQGWDCETWC